jgi:predicted ATPase
VPADGSSRAALARAPAMRMFLERVRDVRPGFKLTDANARVLAELCRRLDGLPLARELAASGMRLLTPEQVLERLDERVARPGGLSDLPDRQQTMKATLAWSYDLLPEPARLIFARLSVFAAPFTTAAAEAVCGSAGTDATAALATLLDHSMISPADRPDGEPAFRLLEVVRAYAAEQLGDPSPTLGRLEGHLLGGCRDYVLAAQPRSRHQRAPGWPWRWRRGGQACACSARNGITSAATSSGHCACG